MAKTIKYIIFLIVVLTSVILFSKCSRRSKLVNIKYQDIDFCEIKGILEKSCLKCHSESGYAPFSFNSLSVFKKKKKTLLYVLENEIMPPWKPDPQYQQYKHQYNLTEEEREKLSTWIFYGCQSKGICEFPVLKGDSLITHKMEGECIQFTAKYKVPENNDHYKCFTIKNPFGQDVYLSSVDVIPSNNKIAHHISVFIDTIDKCNSVVNYDCDNVIANNPIVLMYWTMIGEPLRLTEGQGFLLPKNNCLYIQVHYRDGTKNMVDSSYICLKKVNYPVIEEVFYTRKHRTDLLFEPETIKIDTLISDVEKDIKMHTVSIHTHRLAVAAESFALLPDKTKLNLLRIPKWNYYWERGYEFIEPKYIPKGAKLYLIIKYDNTSNNKMNPFSPPQRVAYGRKSKEEMCVLVYSYSNGKK